MPALVPAPEVSSGAQCRVMSPPALLARQLLLLLLLLPPISDSSRHSSSRTMAARTSSYVPNETQAIGTRRSVEAPTPLQQREPVVRLGDG